MVTTCFFCQSMLSDYLEDLLPTGRQDELRKHIEGCRACAEVHRDLQTTVELAQVMPSNPMSVDISLRITEACQAGTRRFSAALVSRWAFLALVPLLLLVSVVVLFPGLFPGLSQWRVKSDESQFVRYFPMLEGASEIIEEHGNWLHVREPAMRSLWEEGGISPEEFEKSFTGKPSAGEEAK
jgi:predicted anti-sigma-YlaC factor YlaD